MNCQKIICLVLLSFCLLVTRQGVAFQFDAPQPPNVENAPLPPIPTAFYGDVSPVMPASEATVLGEGALGSDCCSCEQQAALSKAISKAHQPLFFDNNFEYLCDDCDGGWFLGDELKRRSQGDCIRYDIGGQYRMRFHNENNHRGLGLTGNDDRFLLHRTRLYANVEVGNYFRAYGEMIDAESNGELLGPRPIEVNRADALNLFVEAKLLDNCNGELWGRVGRMELLYGAQRAVSPLDWANTRRTFEGGLLNWRGTDWDVDAFWTRPVTVNDRRFDRADQSQEFMGLYSTYKAMQNATMEFYFLRYLETAGAGFEFNTIGARYKGGRCNWLWEVEGAYQYGEVEGVNTDSSTFTVGLGRKFECACWKPTLWAFYDWAKGDTQVNGVGTGYHHQFPLAHKYLGFMDLFGRRNIKDANFQLVMHPTKKVKLLVWYHIFSLEDGNDVPYNVVMGPSATAPGGSKDLGQELDLLVSWTLNERMNLTAGYSRFFAGDFYATNGNVPFTGDADFYWTQFTVNF